MYNSEFAITVHPLNILRYPIESILHRLAKVHKPLQNLLLKSRVPEQPICCIINWLLLKWRERNAVVQPCIRNGVIGAARLTLESEVSGLCSTENPLVPHEQHTSKAS